MLKLRVQRAQIRDIPQVHRLVNNFAEQAKLLPRSMSELYEDVRDFFVVRRNHEVIGCAALHVCWADLAEIRALAVAEGWQGKGVGKALVKTCLSEAKKLGISTVFCLTYKPEFFHQFGFRQVDLMSLPRKIWGECQHCPKYPYCDEIAMLLTLKKSAGEAT